MMSSGGCLQGVRREGKFIYICKTFSHFPSVPHFVTACEPNPSCLVRDFFFDSMVKQAVHSSGRRYIRQAGGIFIEQAVRSGGWSQVDFAIKFDMGCACQGLGQARYGGKARPSMMRLIAMRILARSGSCSGVHGGG